MSPWLLALLSHSSPDQEGRESEGDREPLYRFISSFSHHIYLFIYFYCFQRAALARPPAAFLLHHCTHIQFPLSAAVLFGLYFLMTVSDTCIII